MKQTFFKVFCMIFTILLFVRCQKDDTTTTVQEIEETQQGNYSINYVDGESIPDIINTISSGKKVASKGNGSKTSTIPNAFGTISIASVMEVIDTLGNQNYSFVLLPKTPKPNSIFNLVVSVKNGTQNIAIMEYRMAPSFADSYHNGTKTLAEFTGSLLKFPFDPNSTLFAKGDTCIQNIDEVVNCDRIDIDGGQVLGTPSGGASQYTGFLDTTTYTGGDGGNIDHNYGGPTTGGGGGGFWLCNDSCACGNTGPTVCIFIVPDLYTSRSSTAKKGGDCCDGTNITGPIGVNSDIVNVISACVEGLSSDELGFLNSSKNSLAIKNFLDVNGCSDETASFAKLAINALANEEISSFEEMIYIDISDAPKVEDVKKELECFDKTKPAKFTIYSEQCIEGSREVTAILGHTFINIEQDGFTRNLGFYPESNLAAVKDVDSEIHDNSNSPYHVSISINITSEQLKDIINYIENYPKIYNLNKYNCTDFGIAVAEKGGLILPKTVGSYSVLGIEAFKGRNPSDLGEDMRNLTLPLGATRNLIGGNAPVRTGECP